MRKTSVNRAHIDYLFIFNPLHFIADKIKRQLNKIFHTIGKDIVVVAGLYVQRAAEGLVRNPNSHPSKGYFSRGNDSLAQ